MANIHDSVGKLDEIRKVYRLKLPAAIRRTAAVHHGALDDTLHQPKKRRLRRNGSLFLEALKKRSTECIKERQKQRRVPVLWCKHTHMRLSLAFHGLHSQQKVKTATGEKEQQQISTPWSWTLI